LNHTIYVFANSAFLKNFPSKSATMAGINVIITGATGMVGEGVLLECLQNEKVNKVLIVNRKHYDLEHSKLKELIVPDFLKLNEFGDSLKGYEACFFCAGISSIGMKEDKYTQITYDTTIAFAKAFLGNNPGSVFTYISGAHTDSTEKGRVMWARVKGRTENDLMKLPFKAVYHFRPGVIVPFDDQKNWKPLFRWLAKAVKAVAPKSALAVQQIGRAMINATLSGYPAHVLEIKDIRKLAVTTA
jgi:uncharacterized protein YbjT (DUF2867 family)